MTTRKRALVTGASAGIGAATARLLARDGWDVAVHYNSDRKGAEAVAADVEKAGGKALILRANVGEPSEIERMFTELDAAWDGLEGLFNNAGIVAEAATVAEMDAERLTRIFGVNTVGAFLVAGAAARRMSEGATIVNMSSAAARLGGANQYVDYGASKAAIDILTKGMAEELGPKGIRVNGVRPGLIETEIHAKGGQPDRAKRLAHLVPMQRSGSTEEVAEGVVWLMSDAASYVTGTNLDISGGR